MLVKGLAEDKHIDNLVGHDVTSLRKHQQMIEAVLENALNIALIQDTEEVVAVTEDMFAEAEIAVPGAVKHRVGFDFKPGLHSQREES